MRRVNAQGPDLRRRAGSVLLACILLLGGLRAGAEDETAASRLSRALFQEHTEGRHEQALETYRSILGMAGLDPVDRGEAMLGAARCHRALQQLSEALDVWNEILGDPTLPVGVREKAEEARQRHLAEMSQEDDALIRQEAHRRLLEQRRAKALGLVEEARLALAQGRVELARDICLDALAQEPSSPEALDLLAQVERALPDRGELLTSFIRFVHTTSLQAFQRLKADVRELERAGRDDFKATDYARANEHFRKAIRLIDESEFLSDMSQERLAILGWLRKTIEEGRTQGLDLGAEPAFPDPAVVAMGFRRRFYDLLSELFTARPAEEDPLVIYDVRPPPTGAPTPEQTLAAGRFEDGIALARRPGTLSRARWAEHWFRDHLGTGWSDGTSSGGRALGPPRILDRFGELLIVQHTAAIQRQAREVLDGFGTRAAAVTLEVGLFAATTAGGTRMAARLRAQAGPRGDGLDMVVPGRLWAEAVEDVRGLEGVKPLGTCRLVLNGDPAAVLEFTHPAERHPAYAGVPAPPLRVAAETARYGLWLEVYAEDMPDARGGGRAAVSLVATTRQPLATVVVPKPNADGDWLRLPKPMAQQGVTADRIVPHAGTLLVMGLANPFPESAPLFPDLVLLVGVRPAATGGRVATVPDPPRATPASVPGGLEEREYPLGELASEVVDEVLLEGWPRQSATASLSPATLRKARDDYLADRLGVDWAGLVPRGQPSPVSVRGDVAVARLEPASHTRLEQALDRFRAHGAVLYDVDVLSVEVGEAQLAEWLRIGQAQAFTAGTYLVLDTAAEAGLDQRMRAIQAGESLYTLQSRLLARATQRVAARNLRAIAIVEDLRTYRNADGRQRYVPVVGTAEEGIVVLVRPELDVQGKRRVIVDARAARLQSVDPVLLPGIEQQAARVQVPRHAPVQTRQAGVDLADNQSLLLTLPAPDGSGRVILLKVRVTRIQ